MTNTNEHWDAHHQKEQKGLMNKEVTLRFNIGGFLKVLIVLAVLAAVFMLGRWSVSGSEAVAVNSSSSEDHAGFFSNLFGGLSKSSDDASVPVVSSSAVSANSTSVNKTVAAPAVVVSAAPVLENATVKNDSAMVTNAIAAEADTAEEEVLTAYPAGTLAFDITKVQKEWYDTWGKITKLEVTFKNNADGTVKAKYITMTVEGYDYDKKVPLVEDGVVTIKAGQTKNLYVTVPGGFAYNKLTTGDLKTVKITAALFDEADVQITGGSKDYDLQG